MIAAVNNSPFAGRDAKFVTSRQIAERLDLDAGQQQKIEQILEDIESLNRRALGGDLEVTAISIHAYAHLADRYALMPCGASMGDGYGPCVVARSEMTPADLASATVAAAVPPVASRSSIRRTR